MMSGLVHPFVATTALVCAVAGSVALAPAPRAAVPVGAAVVEVRAPSAQRAGVPLDAAPWRQVRIEQRLIIRITPGFGRDMPPPPPSQMMPPPPMQGRPPHKQHAATCLPLGVIASIQPSRSDRQIMLILRDRRQVLADLEKTCSARDFYVGFYVERTEDGMLCTRRDPIHSRAGATCMITRLQEVGH